MISWLRSVAPNQWVGVGLILIAAYACGTLKRDQKEDEA